jgi:hypothetical protein
MLKILLLEDSTNLSNPFSSQEKAGRRVVLHPDAEGLGTMRGWLVQKGRCCMKGENGKFYLCPSLAPAMKTSPKTGFVAQIPQTLV